MFIGWARKISLSSLRPSLSMEPSALSIACSAVIFPRLPPRGVPRVDTAVAEPTDDFEADETQNPKTPRFARERLCTKSGCGRHGSNSADCQACKHTI